MKIKGLIEALELINSKIDNNHDHEDNQCFIVGATEAKGSDWKRAKIKDVNSAGNYDCGCPRGVILTVEY